MRPQLEHLKTFTDRIYISEGPIQNLADIQYVLNQLIELMDRALPEDKSDDV